jgi:hypothetical protein
MKSLYSLPRAVLCALVMTACATDRPAAEDDPATTTDTSQVVVVPRELSTQPIDGTFDGNEFTGTTNACHVTLLFCRDPRLSPPAPSFCQNGGCSTEQAREAGFALCNNICGSCGGLRQFPNSPGC